LIHLLGDPKFIKVNGIKTRYFEAGRGEPLVLVHGGGFGSLSYSANVWSLNFHALAQNFHIYAFDKLGQGCTDNPPSNSAYTMSSVIAHAYGFLRELGINNANLLGHPRGALPITRIAIEHPDVVHSLIIVDSNTLAPDHPSTPRNFYLNLEPENHDRLTREAVSREPLANSYLKDHITGDYLDALLEIAGLPKSIEAKKKHNPANRQINLRRQFEEDLSRLKKETLEAIKAGHLRTPVLIIWGNNDPSAPVELAMSLFQILTQSDTDAQLHVFNRAGHYVFREQAEAFNNLITASIKGQAAKRSNVE
jgi:pimeloyl-ACP methyl ester carboxylesterase